MRTWAVLTASVLVMVLGASQAQAAEIGGRTYGTSDLVLGGNYSFNAGPPASHAWANGGAADTWSSLVTVDGANSVTVTVNRVNMNVAGGSLTGGVVNMNSTLSGAGFTVWNGGVWRLANVWSIGNNNGVNSVESGGQMRFTADGSGISLNNKTVTWKSNATLAVDAVAGMALLSGLAGQEGSTFDIQAGAIVMVTNNATLKISGYAANELATTTLSPGATLWFGDKGGGTRNAPTIGGNWTLGSGTTLRFDKGVTVSGTTPLSLTSSGTLMVVSNGNLAVTAPSTLTLPSTMTLQLDTGAGIAGTVNLQGVANVNAALSQSGTFTVKNGAVLNMKMIGDWSISPSATLLSVESGGQLRFVTAGSGIYNNHMTAQVLAGGMLAVDHTGTSTLSSPNTVNNGQFNFATNATIALLNGGSLIGTNSRYLYFNGTTPGGALGVNIINNGGVLDIKSLQVTPTVFTSIAAGTTLDMRGAGAIVRSATTDLLQSQLATVNGTLLVSDGFSLTPGGGKLTVSSTGTLGGNGGTIAGTVTNSGAIAPGLSGVGTLNVTGNVNFNNGSTYQVDVGAGADNADKLVITGAATIGSGSGINLAINQVSTPNQASYVIATAASGLDVGTITVTGMPDGCRLVRTATQLTIVRSRGTIIMVR